MPDEHLRSELDLGLPGLVDLVRVRVRGRGRVRVRVRVRVMVRDSYPNPNSPTFSWCRPPAPP